MEPAGQGASRGIRQPDLRMGRDAPEKPRHLGKVRHTLANAELNRVEHPKAPVNSGYTKVASFATVWLVGVAGRRPQAINDSRVATALTCRLDATSCRRATGALRRCSGLGDGRGSPWRHTTAQDVPSMAERVPEMERAVCRHCSRAGHPRHPERGWRFPTDAVPG